MPVATKNKNSVAELRQQLIGLGYDKDKAESLSKAEVLQELEKNINTIEESLNTLTADEAIAIKEINIEEKMVEPTWTPYVMQQFDPSELENGNPRTDALRRVAAKLLGRFCSDTEILQVPEMSNGGRATVVVNLEFIKDGLRISGAADTYAGNTPKEYYVHAVATAETRAEGRALRKALMLTKILSAEEMQKPSIDEPNGSDGRILSDMLNSLKLMADRVGIDLFKLSIVEKFNIQVLEDLTHAQGLKLGQEISKIQRKERDITDDIKK